MRGKNIFRIVLLVPINTPNRTEATTANKYGGIMFATVSAITLNIVPSLRSFINIAATFSGEGKNQFGIQLNSTAMYHRASNKIKGTADRLRFLTFSFTINF